MESWSICKFEGGGVDFFSFLKFPEIPKENGDLVNWEPPRYSKLFWNKNTLSRDIHQRYPPQRLKRWGWKTNYFPFGGPASWPVLSWILGSVLLQCKVRSVTKSRPTKPFLDYRFPGIFVLCGRARASYPEARNIYHSAASVWKKLQKRRCCLLGWACWWVLVWLCWDVAFFGWLWVYPNSLG